MSDFAYGQRLVYFEDGIEFAFIDLLEDVVFLRYEEEVKNILGKNGVEYVADNVRDFVNKFFGIACDTANGMDVNFELGQKKCLYCGSDIFERNMIEPESVIEITVPVISHEGWNKLDDCQKNKLIFNELKKRDYYKVVNGYIIRLNNQISNT